MQDSTPGVFHAVLFPHRSLSRKGFFTLMAIVIAVMGFAALRSFAIGAWPVALFAIADVALIYIAFKLSYRSGRAFEEVTVSATEVLVRKVSPSGMVSEHRFHPGWARLTITQLEDEGVTRLDLASHGQRIVVGAFLNPDDRASFAKAFSEALAAASRAGGPLLPAATPMAPQ